MKLLSEKLKNSTFRSNNGCLEIVYRKRFQTSNIFYITNGDKKINIRAYLLTKRSLYPHERVFVKCGNPWCVEASHMQLISTKKEDSHYKDPANIVYNFDYFKNNIVPSIMKEVNKTVKKFKPRKRPGVVVQSMPRLSTKKG